MHAAEVDLIPRCDWGFVLDDNPIDPGPVGGVQVFDGHLFVSYSQDGMIMGNPRVFEPDLRAFLAPDDHVT